MDKFREFEGKDLDACIRNACEYFNAPREKLEIELIQDAKSGIFGIVLARKAKIRARRAQLTDTVQDILKQASAMERGEAAEESARGKANTQPDKPSSARAQKEASREKKAANAEGKAAPKPARKPAPQRMEKAAPAEEAPAEGESFPVIEGREDVLDIMDSARPMKQPEELDSKELADKAVGIVTRLVGSLADRDVKASASVNHGSVHARVEWQGDAGLLIGREGQTLAALQYLASRMLSRAFNAPLRVQLDIGEYRSRQNEKLRSLALALAARARQTGKSFSTRPLSSYHRRIIHLTLQDEADLATRSSGDGPMKRVIISARKSSEK